MTSSYSQLVWFRHDLRVADNPALDAACKTGEPVAGIYFFTRKTAQQHGNSERRMQLTERAVAQLSDSLAALGIPLFVIDAKRFDAVAELLIQKIGRLGVRQVYLNAEYALDEKRRDSAVIAACQNEQIQLHQFDGSVLQSPGRITNQQGNPYKVFTAFKNEFFRRWQGRMPLRTPKAVASPIKSLQSDANRLLKLDELPDALNFADSELTASLRLNEFLSQGIEDYAQDRNIPAKDGTSQLSSSLMLGLISPLQCLVAAENGLADASTKHAAGIQSWINELVWREFYIHVLAAFPDISRGKALRPETNAVPWRHDVAEFQRWCVGNTGFPLVDAAMRQLNTTGWMHNRLRMLTAVFLSKYLLIDWRWGERYFMSQLVDGNLAANNGGWQWSASTGTDAVPYFRLLSPIRQAQRFDPQATFIKSQIPLLGDLDPRVIHSPGHQELLALGYPPPMVDLKFGRERCLNSFKFIRRQP